MVLGGYANRIARVDLTSGKVEYQEPNEEDLRKYIGGRGLGVKYVFDNGPGVEPLSNENVLCFMMGPMVGSDFGMSGRMAVVTRSPLTGTVTDAHQGGWSGARLRWAGFDGIVFKGRAPRPTYAYIENSEITLRDATDAWGKNTHETVDLMMAKHGKQDTSVITIGRAGEKLVRFAAIMNENDRAAARGGVGAVMGFKNLKCLVAKGRISNRPKHASPEEEYRKAVAQVSRKIVTSPVVGPRKGGMSIYGTNGLMNMINEFGGLPTRNGQQTQFEHADKIGGEAVKEQILVGNPTCHACPVACKKEVEIKDGPYKVRMESTEYESMWTFGANCGNPRLETIPKMIHLTNDYGMDTIETGNTMSVAMEASQRGLIKEKFEWGDVDAMIDLVHKIGNREGIGNTLAEGCRSAARSFGDEGMANQVKGQAIPAYDPRGFQGMGLAYATSNRGACHVRGFTVDSEAMGSPYKTDPHAWEGKGKLLKGLQDMSALRNSLDVCLFSNYAEDLSDYVAEYSAMTGVDIDAEGLLKIGERVYNLERHYNNLCGFTGKDDTLPDRFLKTPGTGPAAGHVCELDKMKVEYYEVRGWVDGVVPKEKLRALGIVP